MIRLVNIIKEVEDKPTYSAVDRQFLSLVEELEVQRIKNIIVQNLGVLEKEIDNAFLNIGKCNDMHDAKVYFDTLQKIQEFLAKLFFSGEIKVSDKLENFIRECDRLDDDLLRNSLFKQIKEESGF